MILGWGNWLGKKTQNPGVKYAIISHPTLPAVALMELIVLDNNKIRGKYACAWSGEMWGGPKTPSAPKSAAEVGDTEAVSKRGRIVFIWAEIKIEQLPQGGL